MNISKNLLIGAAITGALALAPISVSAGQVDSALTPSMDKAACSGKGGCPGMGEQDEKKAEDKDKAADKDKDKSACSGKAGCGGKDKQ
jgi:hypothetical protein